MGIKHPPSIKKLILTRWSIIEELGCMCYQNKAIYRDLFCNIIYRYSSSISLTFPLLLFFWELWSLSGLLLFLWLSLLGGSRRTYVQGIKTHIKFLIGYFLVYSKLVDGFQGLVNLSEEIGGCWSSIAFLKFFCCYEACNKLTYLNANVVCTKQIDEYALKF